MGLGAMAHANGDADQVRRRLLAGLERAEQESDAEAIAVGLEALAEVAEAVRASSLLGAAESIRRSAATPRDEFEAQHAGRVEAAASVAIGHQAVTAAVRRGRSFTLDEALLAARQS